MADKANKDLKLFFSLSEVAQQYHIPESTLRFWEKSFPEIKPLKAGGGIRQYRREDVEMVGLIHHLVKEKGMTLQGARQRIKQNPTTAAQNAKVVEQLKGIREELVRMKKQLDYLT
jgi:DNA-binding transcriptional MerR regulator